MRQKRVAVGVSGGVDSAVALALLKAQGYQVLGVHLRLFAPDEESAFAAEQDAKKICEFLGVEFLVFDLQKQFNQQVINPFIAEYVKGITPNPCIFCNKKIKFGFFWHQVQKLGIDYLATGHYAIKEQINGEYLIKRGLDLQKDQSYALYNLNQDLLPHLLFPLGELEKTAIRAYAKKIGLQVFNKAESQDICFIKDNQYGDFIKEKAPSLVKKGAIVDENNQELGSHKGLCYYTIGQRKKLGLALGYPAYITKIDYQNNQIVVGPKAQLYADGLLARDYNFLRANNWQKPVEIKVQIRYNAEAVVATLFPGLKYLKVLFAEPQKAVTPGQSAVFYQGDTLLGGGIIFKSFSK